MVGIVRSSHRGRVEDASDELKVRLALLGRAVGLGGCNAELAESAYPMGFVGVPSRCSGRFAQRSSCSVKARERACVASARDLEADKIVDTSEDIALEALAVGCCKLVGRGNGEIVDSNDDEQKRAFALEGEDARFAQKLLEAVALQEVRVRLLPKMPFLASFKYHVQLANELLTCRLFVLFEAFRLLTVKVGVAKHCLRKSLTTSMPFNSRSKSATSAKKMRIDVALAVAVKVLSKWTPGR
eukprot:2318041-Pleurochrysis_carterae.AAC.1